MLNADLRNRCAVARVVDHRQLDDEVGGLEARGEFVAIAYDHSAGGGARFVNLLKGPDDVDPLPGAREEDTCLRHACHHSLSQACEAEGQIHHSTRPGKCPFDPARRGPSGR